MKKLRKQITKPVRREEIRISLSPAPWSDLLNLELHGRRFGSTGLWTKAVNDERRSSYRATTFKDSAAVSLLTRISPAADVSCYFVDTSPCLSSEKNQTKATSGFRQSARVSAECRQWLATIKPSIRPSGHELLSFGTSAL